MSHTLKKLEKSEVEFTVTVTPADYEKHLKKAAEKLSERTAVKGFRKGKVPYDIMKKEAGEMAIMQEALEAIVKETFYNAVKEESLETIGMPKIDIDKLAPGNDIVYRAIVGLMPKVKLADISKIKVEKKTKIIDEKSIDETLDAVRGMNAAEVIKAGSAEGTDKLVIDMDMLLDNVPVEGGQAKDYQVYLSEDHYVPGFNDQVKGLKKDDEKEFTLDFPENHYQKMLAGKNVKFKIKVKDVYERQLPELNEEFAKKLGQESIAKLRELIKQNLEKEAETKSQQEAEIEMLDTLIEKSEFGEIPDVIIDSERQKMFFELKNDLARHNIPLDQYLADIKKKEEDLFNDFKAQAEKRAKASLISRQVAINQDIKISDEELEKEINTMKEMYKEDPETLEKLKSPEVRETLATTLQNKKVMEYLKSKILD